VKVNLSSFRRISLSRKTRLIASLLILFLAWEAIAGFVEVFRNVPFPTPLETFTRLADLVTGEPLYGIPIYKHLVDSVSRWILGFSLAVAVGIPLGILLGYSTAMWDLFMPIIYVIQTIPGPAWIAVALMLFGLGNAPAVFMIFIVVFHAVVITTASGARGISRRYVNAAKMLGADSATIFFKVFLPAATLPIVSGLRIGLGNGWRVMVAAEMIAGTASGLGYSIIESRWSLDFTSAFVCMLLVSAFGLLTQRVIFAKIERRIMRRVGLMEVS